MARMNWDRANKRDLVRERGGESATSGLGRDPAKPKKSKKKRKAKKTEFDGSLCAVTGARHVFGPWTEYAFPHFSKSRICTDCGKKQESRTSGRGGSEPSTKQLEQRLSRLTGETYEQPHAPKLITSRSSGPSPRPRRRNSSKSEGPSPIRFDRSVHVVHRIEADTRWRCNCSWIGSERGDEIYAIQQHADNWHKEGPRQQRDWEIEAINKILADRKDTAT